MWTQLPCSKGAQPPPNFRPCLLWPNGWMDQVGTWHGGGPHCARWGPSSAPQKDDRAPNFRPMHVYCGQMSVCVRMPLGTEVGRSLSDIVLDGDPAPLPKGAQPQFSANVRCGQTARWTKMQLSMEVGLAPSDCVGWGPSSHTKKRHLGLCWMGTQLSP